ncbi:MAG: T9SS type A sorting domain-containing protein, partial [Rhodothermia bacterium]
VSIPEASEVKISLFDLLGSEVRTLVRGRVAAGIHEIELSSEGLAPGVYLIRLEAGGRTAVTSVIVAR